MSAPYRYYILNKPYQVLSRFTADGSTYRTIKDIIDVPKDVYPVGRLDRDTEGLLFLTNDPRVNKALLHPNRHVEKTYWAQVEGLVDDAKLLPIREGMTISLKGKKHNCRPAEVRIIEQPERLWDRIPPIRYRKEIPTSWVELTLTEGKNRQVRKMLAGCGYPVLRLIRTRIGGRNLADLGPGGIVEVEGFE